MAEEVSGGVDSGSGGDIGPSGSFASEAIHSAVASIESSNPTNPVDDTPSFEEYNPDAGSTAREEPEPEPEVVAPAAAVVKPLDDGQKKWAEWAGIPVELAEANWEKVLPAIQRQYQLYQAQVEAAQRAALPAGRVEQKPAEPEPWEQTFQWEDPNVVDPEMLKYSQHQQAAFQKSMQRAMQEIRTLKEQLAPVDGLIRETQQAKMNAQVQAFHQEVESLNDPEFFGSKDAPNHDARSKAWQAAHSFVQMGLAPNHKKAIEMAYHALAGQKIAQKTVQTISTQAQARKTQTVAQPTSRGEKKLPLGPQRAAIEAAKLMQSWGHQVHLDADTLASLGE